MVRNRGSNPFRIGLQLKSAVILTFIVLTAMAVGGGYFDKAESWLRSEDNRRAMRIAQALGLAAQKDLTEQSYGSLQRLVREYLRNDSIDYVAILDSSGSVVASASREGGADPYGPLRRLPVSVSVIRRLDGCGRFSVAE